VLHGLFSLPATRAEIATHPKSRRRNPTGNLQVAANGAGTDPMCRALYNGEAHDYIPDFIVRLKTEPPLHLIIEVKGYDERADIKAQAA
jgi:hypothetical protein